MHDEEAVVGKNAFTAMAFAVPNLSAGKHAPVPYLRSSSSRFSENFTCLFTILLAFFLLVLPAVLHSAFVPILCVIIANVSGKTRAMKMYCYTHKEEAREGEERST